MAVGAIAASGGFSKKSSKTNAASVTQTRTPSTATATTSTTAPDTTASKDAVIATLHDYENAYSAHDGAALGNLFTADVFRHGLRGGGCADTRGRQAVVNAYEEQFQAGTGTYRLTDLSRSAIEVTGDSASINTGYTISSGSSGTISFELRDTNGRWLISRIVASC